MSLGEHLEELRKRIILGFIGPLILAIGVLTIGKTLVMWMCLPLNVTQLAYGLDPTLIPLTPFEAFITYLKVSLIGGLVLGLPWLLYQMWMFISKGLYEKEQRLVVMLLPGSAALAIFGVLFMYFVMLPACLAFLIGFSLDFPQPAIEKPGYFHWAVGQFVDSPQADDTNPENSTNEPDPPPQTQPAVVVVPRLTEDPVEPLEGQIWVKMPERKMRMWLNGELNTVKLTPKSLFRQEMRLNDYISFVLRMALAFSVCFQLPLVMLLIAMVRMSNYQKMRSVWKYVLLGCFVLGAFLTPADPISQCLLAGPMFGLYWVGLGLMRMIEVRRANRAAESPEAGE